MHAPLIDTRDLHRHPHPPADDDADAEADHWQEELSESYEMAQKTYGVAPDREVDVEVHSAYSNHESAALLGDDATPKPLAEGAATLQSSVGNLANTIIGSGAS